MIDGWNAERILLAAECIGDGYWFIEKAVAYAKSGRFLELRWARTRAIQFPLARAYSAICAADMMRYRGAALFDSDERMRR